MLTRLAFGLMLAVVVFSLPGKAAGEEQEWFAFAPGEDRFSTNSGIDLRFLNEKYAGENGRIGIRNGRFVHMKTGKPVRFWGVNGPPHDLSGDDLRKCARLLAKRGVNLVRIHGAVFDRKTGEFNPASVKHIREVVKAMKGEGIYSHLSIYFPLWFTPQPGLSWLQGYDGSKYPFAALYFNEEFQKQYREWWQGLLTTPDPATGKTLLDEPALMSVEIINEDSYFFWTFSEENIPDPQLRILEKRFGDWLIRKHGSLEKAFDAWKNLRSGRDAEAEGRVGFRPLWNLFNEKTPRDRDTAAFLFGSQTEFYGQTLAFLRKLGFRGLVTCSNWTTASPEVLGPLEKACYAPGDFIDRHGYFGCRSGGQFSEWSIRDGHTYIDRSALRFDPEDPGKPKAFNHPVMDVHYNDRPSMISETTWTRPNRYRSEAPLFFAVYGALQDSDAIVHFALDGINWDVKPQFWMQQWTLMAPSQMGQFPAAALIYRKGLVSTGALLADIRLKLQDLIALKGTPLPQDAAFDELRLKDVPKGTTVRPGNRIDPLIHFAGRTRVTFSLEKNSAKLRDLSRFIDRKRQRVASSTGELRLDYGKGVLTIDALAAQGVSGHLKAAGPVRLKDLFIASGLELGHIIAVSLDGKPLRSSKKILLQVMSEEKNNEFQAVPQGSGRLIRNIGTNPWMVRQLQGTVRLKRPDSVRMKVTALDGNGYPVRKVGNASEIRLLPDVLYYLLTR